jgi:hypothetical protein
MTHYDLNVAFNDMTIINNSNDNDFIWTSLGGMGYSHRLSVHKDNSKLIFLENKHFTRCNVSKCPYGS